MGRGAHIIVPEVPDAYSCYMGTPMRPVRPKGPMMASIARALTLRLGGLSFPPDATHTPGVAPATADKFSRVVMPDGAGVVDKSIHPSLCDAVVAAVPDRNDSWYRLASMNPPLTRNVANRGIHYGNSMHGQLSRQCYFV